MSTRQQENRKLANRAFLRRLSDLWDSYPEQRFGQLVMNLSRDPDGFADTWEWSNSAWRERIDQAHDLWAAVSGQGSRRGDPSPTPGRPLRECDQAILDVLADGPRSGQEIAGEIRRRARDEWAEREGIAQTWDEDEPPAMVKLLAHGDARDRGLKLLGYEVAPRLRYLERHGLVVRIQLDGHRPMLWRLA